MPPNKLNPEAALEKLIELNSRACNFEMVRKLRAKLEALRAEKLAKEVAAMPKKVEAAPEMDLWSKYEVICKYEAKRNGR